MIENFKQSSSARFTSVSRFERDFFSPMRNLGQQALDDFGGSDLLDATVRFEEAMARLAAVGRASAGGGVAATDLMAARRAWDDGRTALNHYVATLNGLAGDATGLRLAAVPADASGAAARQPRYLAFKKELAKCQQGGVGVNMCAGIMRKYTGDGTV
ncbi:unnamed protein product [Phaeothamnion confervicola]